MKAHHYDRLFALGMALVMLILLILMFGALGCTIEHKQSITIKKAKTCEVEKSAMSKSLEEE